MNIGGYFGRGVCCLLKIFPFVVGAKILKYSKGNENFSLDLKDQDVLVD